MEECNTSEIGNPKTLADAVKLTSIENQLTPPLQGIFTPTKTRMRSYIDYTKDREDTVGEPNPLEENHFRKIQPLHFGFQ